MLRVSSPLPLDLEAGISFAFAWGLLMNFNVAVLEDGIVRKAF